VSPCKCSEQALLDVFHSLFKLFSAAKTYLMVYNL
jgi:hypothetical protein